MSKHVAIIGASGAIGGALTDQFLKQEADVTVHAFSRTAPHPKKNLIHHVMDYASDASIAACADLISENSLDTVIVATGILHQDGYMPEKSLQQIQRNHFQHILMANTIIPSLIIKSFIGKLNNQIGSKFALLSAKLGSISDNKIGGWHAYRASKAALNMIIKNASIELARINKRALIVGLHPGTVDSPLSKPFQSHVPRLFTPQECAEHLYQVIERLDQAHSGQCLSWSGDIIKP